MTRFRLFRPALVALLAMTLVLSAACLHAAGAIDKDATGDDYLAWLEGQSMLHRAYELSLAYSGQGKMWRHPYAESQPRSAASLASVWFTAYPASIVTRKGESVLKTLGSEELWKVFAKLGVQGLHTGPMKRAGGLEGREFTPTIDGQFDRISMEIDPTFGTDEEYIRMSRNAADSGGIVIGDVIPGHTGKGADWLLAERAYKDYPGLFHMVEIAPEDWPLLPGVAAGQDGANLGPEAVDRLKAKGYIVGQLPRTIFYQPGVKETDWTATGVVKGADGKGRRWVYLHYFKAGQPTLNWLDPSFAAQRLLIGDVLHSLGVLGERMLRLDANGFLGIELGKEGGPAWSEGHPLSPVANQLIAGMVRKLGGFTFQELNLTIEDLARSAGGADLSYDFVTRTAYAHALLAGDAEFLRLMMKLQRQAGVSPATLIHALQNHDELTLELVHFWMVHKDDPYPFRGKSRKGSELRDLIRAEMQAAMTGKRAPYNLTASNGVSCTMATLVAAALGLEDVAELSPADRKRIQQGHRLLALFNAMQPGVFAVSGWDLVGALTLPGDQVKSLMTDGDTRWINRGAYDLLGVTPDSTGSSAGMPRAEALYGPLPAQLERPDSFASQLRHLLSVRKEYRIFEAEQLPPPEVKAKGLLVMVHRLPDGLGTEVTALNFGRESVEEEVALEGVTGKAARDLLNPNAVVRMPAPGHLLVQLEPLEGRVLLVK